MIWTSCSTSCSIAAWRRRTWPIGPSAAGCGRAIDGLPCIGLPRSPLPAFFVEWAGVQNGSYLLTDCPEKCAEALRLMEEQESPIIDAVCELAPPLVHFPDNLSSDCMTSLYDDHLAGVHRRRIERLHAAGVKCAVHLDGTVKGLLPKLIASGFDAIEALTPKPGGDLDVEEIRMLADPHARDPLGRRARHHVRAAVHLATNGIARAAADRVLARPAVHPGRGRSGAARRRHRVLPPNRGNDPITCR